MSKTKHNHYSAEFKAKDFSRRVRLEGKSWLNLTTPDSVLCNNANFCQSTAPPVILSLAVNLN